MTPLRPGQEKTFVVDNTRRLQVPPPQVREENEQFRPPPELPKGMSGELGESHHGQSSRGPGLAVVNKKGG